MQVEATPLLRTKLDVPPTRAHTLARERLLALVPDAPGTRLVLLSAPAGFGKTTFLATWCHARALQGARVAWVALDQGDNEPVRFLAYLHAAISRAMRPLDERNDDSDAAWPGAVDRAVALTQLINALAAFDYDLVLVLDDYHVISAPAVHATVAFLLDHLPDRVRLAIGSRADPPLPLARLRAREQLIELRAVQLRFTTADVQAFFQAVGNPTLTHDQACAISAYAEGWPAGVQLIALALRSEAQAQVAEVGAAAPAAPLQRVLERLDASQRHVFAYLADDVFERQPPHLKSFLLQTAVLDRMCAPLCDAILRLETGDRRLDEPVRTSSQPPASSRILEELERGNLFLIPLDHQRRWYRYHHLFHAFLRARLDCEPPGTLAELHRRASAWFECHQFPVEAVEHALAAGDAAHAAELIDQSRRWPLSHPTLERSDMLVELLSQRELEVLRLIAGGASNQAIAAALVISLGTVKSHINHILGKLAASNRTEAVARARDHGLLTN
jgi:LuxR family transcriptional regulator, maltose regulon positive regulatory protein